ncbi:metalloregulator ArsR/SmtB family transcription factor [Altererythrobacter sp. KTW20L]|uniref:ArsR/SmtB family transcription factor n=1 Tax=Altererythrobacter sp. KTW20L TaxID=2942210 RepID=UPI0020BFB4F4|nr:metalloregulator ArsR/SmtB family transcription factor [Altererythrobacter sp. KTW20L]MCL6250448.1 metalloregulator ArsR/SmtB family transcription factor [Altererythrobacter sp. KTW20L]
MSAIYEDRDVATGIADKLRVFAQPQRLMILSCLLRGERTVSEIGEVTGITQPALSQQLAELRRADLVSTRKEAKQVWYALADEGAVTCVQTMELIFCGGEPLPTLARPAEQLAAPSLNGVAAFARVL